jgi:hypothetical protein
MARPEWDMRLFNMLLDACDVVQPIDSRRA